MTHTTASKRHTLKRFMLSSMAMLLTAPALVAQSASALTPVPGGIPGGLPELPPPQLPKPRIPQLPIKPPTLTLKPKFSCGPNLATYVVRPLNNRPGQGIRCVKFSNGSPNSPRTPRLAWYGEGNWYGKTYRHMGHAFDQGRALQGYASDIYGNGEDINNNFPGNLNVQIINASRIRVTGAWNEEWIRVKETAYKPLARPKTCGRYLEQYRVADLLPIAQGGRKGDGLRCVLKVGPAGTYAPKRRFTTWFGNGQWQGNYYSHVGTRATSGVGASDICGTTFGPVCNNFAYGSLNMTPVGGGYNVTGAWRERWR